MGGAVGEVDPSIVTVFSSTVDTGGPMLVFAESVTPKSFIPFVPFVPFASPPTRSRKSHSLNPTLPPFSFQRRRLSARRVTHSSTNAERYSDVHSNCASPFQLLTQLGIRSLTSMSPP